MYNGPKLPWTSLLWTVHDAQRPSVTNAYFQVIQLNSFPQDMTQDKYTLHFNIIHKLIGVA